MEDATLTNPNAWVQDAVKKGLILGGIHIVIFLLLYILAPGKLASLSYGLFAIVFNIVYIIIQGRSWRKEVGGYMDYGAAFKYLFVLLLASGVLVTIFNIVFGLVDPDLPAVMAQATLDTSMYWAEKMGAPQETLDKIEADFDMEEAKSRFSIVGQLTSFGIGLIIYAVIAAIFALVVRKVQPETI